jgi:hypothetical protein
MDEPQTIQWLIQSGRIIMADLLRHDKRDPAEFYAVSKVSTKPKSTKK